jgi:uncharacterized membrane protein YcaP (DUF421 family)
MTDWEAIFVPSTSVLELCVRGTVTFLALFAMMRIVGQRESGGLGVTDLLVVVLVADAASAGFSGNAKSIADGIVLVVSVLFWSIVLDWLAYRWPRLNAIIKGKPRPLIRDGQLDRAVMRRELMTMDEVLSQLRVNGIEKIDDVHRAYLEPNGMISIIRRDGPAD